VICASSIWKPFLAGAVVVASFTAGAEAPLCSPAPGSYLPMMAGLPFTADLVQERWTELPDGSDGHHFKTVYSVARDNDGRVSVKLQGYTSQSGSHLWSRIDIWDPIAGTKTSFESCGPDANDPSSTSVCAVKKVARVWAAPRRKPDSGPPVFPDPFKPLPPHHSSELVPRGGELTDLGEKSIEGTKARGYRNVGASRLTCDGLPLTTSKEWWLSEETAMEVSATTRVSGPDSLHSACSSTTTIELTNIQRGEPEAELFQVPSDYEIVQHPTPKPPSLPRGQKMGDTQTQ
jgi:hypothetical protein